MRVSKSIINKLYLSFVFIWPLLQMNVLGGFDFFGRILIAVSLAECVLNIKSILRAPKPVHLILVWIIYAAINTRIKGYSIEGIPYINWVFKNLVVPYIVLLIAYVESKRDFVGLSRWMFFSLLLFLVIGIPFLHNELTYDGSYRYANGLGNDFSNISYTLSVYGLILFSCGKIRFRHLLCSLALLFFILSLTATRKAILALAVVCASCMLGYVMISGSKRGAIVFILSAVSFFLAYKLLMSFSQVGARNAYASEATMFGDSLFLKMLGDRAIQYVVSFDMFLQHPVNGIGLMNFRPLNGFNDELPLHSEYMVQLCECGIIGVSMFLLFWFFLWKRMLACLIKGKRKSVISYIIFGALLSVMLIDFTAWSYDSPQYYVIYGIAFAWFDLNRYENTVYRRFFGWRRSRKTTDPVAEEIVC